ncbi:MAG TPA: tetratricopeptide repeat protein [Planktothrix sp.]|jgi:tetratricopeptide (TPR) repeat protein
MPNIWRAILCLLLAGSVSSAHADEPKAESTKSDTSSVKSEGSVDSSAQPENKVSRADHLESIAHYNKAVGYHQSGFYNHAIDEYLAAVEKDPNLEQAWANLGSSYTVLKKYDAALDAFKKALAIKPNDVVMIRFIGAVQFAQGTYDEAANSFQRALEMDPTSALTASDLAGALDKLGRSAKAKELRQKYNITPPAGIKPEVIDPPKPSSKP